jgi:two-component system, OmpR family, sensor histidine kinase ArlS
MSILQLTIRQRLPLYISVSALVIFLLEGFFIYEYSVRFYEQEFRDRIQERLDEADALISKDRQYPFTAINALPAGNLPEEKIIYATDPSKLKVNDEESLSAALLDTLQFHECTYCFKHIGQREYGIRHDSATHHTLVVSAIDRYGQSKINNLKSGLVIGVLFGVLLLTLASWFWVKKMLQPIADKIKKARNIGVKSLNLRLNVKNSHDELGQLALTFNEMLERIEHSFRTHQQFIRNASHEIRTPLTAITTEADLALQGNRSVEYQREALQNIRLQAEHLADLVAQLLLMAKVEAPGTLNDEPCATDEILLNAIQAIQIKYALGRQAIQLQIDAADASQLLVRCDPVILQAAFSNLLDNAIKYGSSQPVSVRLFALDRWVRLEVEDQGMGITPEDLEQIFIPFYRGRQNKHFSGSGIGLSLVKNIAEKYGGTIHVQSNWGSGTLVQFDLPR